MTGNLLSLSPPQRLLWVTERLRRGETKKYPARASALASLQLPTFDVRAFRSAMGKKLVEEETPASEVSESIHASKRMQT